YEILLWEISTGTKFILPKEIQVEIQKINQSYEKHTDTNFDKAYKQNIYKWIPVFLKSFDVEHLKNFYKFLWHSSDCNMHVPLLVYLITTNKDYDNLLVSNIKMRNFYKLNNFA